MATRSPKRDRSRRRRRRTPSSSPPSCHPRWRPAPRPAWCDRHPPRREHVRRGRRTGDVGAAAADRVAPAPLVCERGQGVRPRAGQHAPRFRLLARSQVTDGPMVLTGAAGGATGSGTTTLEAALVADVEPPEFDALTTTRRVRPTSPATSTRVAGGGGAAQVDAAPARGVATTPLVAVPRRRVRPGTGRRAQRLGLLGSARDRGHGGVRGRLERRRRRRPRRAEAALVSVADPPPFVAVTTTR